MFEVRGTLANHTEYEFGILWSFVFYDSYGAVIEDSYIDYVESVPPNSTYEISCYMPDRTNTFSYNWEFMNLPT